MRVFRRLASLVDDDRRDIDTQSRGSNLRDPDCALTVGTAVLQAVNTLRTSQDSIPVGSLAPFDDAVEATRLASALPFLSEERVMELTFPVLPALVICGHAPKYCSWLGDVQFSSLSSDAAGRRGKLNRCGPSQATTRGSATPAGGRRGSPTAPTRSTRSRSSPWSASTWRGLGRCSTSVPAKGSSPGWPSGSEPDGCSGSTRPGASHRARSGPAVLIYARASAEPLPFPGRTFDAVVAVWSSSTSSRTWRPSPRWPGCSPGRAVLVLPQPSAAPDPRQRMDRRPHPGGAVLADRSLSGGGQLYAGGGKRGGIAVRAPAALPLRQCYGRGGPPGRSDGGAGAAGGIFGTGRRVPGCGHNSPPPLHAGGQSAVSDLNPSPRRLRYLLPWVFPRSPGTVSTCRGSSFSKTCLTPPRWGPWGPESGLYRHGADCVDALGVKATWSYHHHRPELLKPVAKRAQSRLRRSRASSTAPAWPLRRSPRRR